MFLGRFLYYFLTPQVLCYDRNIAHLLKKNCVKEKTKYFPRHFLQSHVYNGNGHKHKEHKGWPLCNMQTFIVLVFLTARFVCVCDGMMDATKQIAYADDDIITFCNLCDERDRTTTTLFMYVWKLFVFAVVA